MKKTRPFLILLYVALLTLSFIGQGSLSLILTAEGDENVLVLQKKAAQGDANSQNELGLMYYGGRGVPQNYREALCWFRKAANNGIVIAQRFLGLMYYNGHGTPQNYSESAKWHQKAAERGDIVSQIMLGFMLGSGQGIPQNFKSAYIWFSIAAANSTGKDYDYAVYGRNTVINALTIEQVNEAQQIASKWKPKKGK